MASGPRIAVSCRAASRRPRSGQPRSAAAASSRRPATSDGNTASSVSTSAASTPYAAKSARPSPPRSSMSAGSPRSPAARTIDPMSRKDKGVSREGKSVSGMGHETETMAEHFDVLIIGAGLSGIGAAWRLREQLPAKTYAILEARDAIGGTWDLFRYPGGRSASDMFPPSSPFRPGRERESIARGDKIRRYIEETAIDGGILPHIRFGSRVVTADWASDRARWTVGLADGSSLTCDFLYGCAGYYDYASGYQPDFPGISDFSGRVIHPQFWPSDLDYTGKKVVVIGSGATAVTLVPAMAPDAAQVTMLQRSPTYMTVLPERDVIADGLRRVLPPGLANRLTRAKNIAITQGFYQLARRRPQRVRKILRSFAVRALDDPAYVDEHFNPKYDPWDQRLCVIPSGD